ncbi:hypothetical protein H0H93_013485 [Arthromyces matolae]|nr:hypothetical protein H0H93_013485 [Arthromyces matolae]
MHTRTRRRVNVLPYITLSITFTIAASLLATLNNLQFAHAYPIASPPKNHDEAVNSPNHFLGLVSKHKQDLFLNHEGKEKPTNPADAPKSIFQEAIDLNPKWLTFRTDTKPPTKSLETSYQKLYAEGEREAQVARLEEQRTILKKWLQDKTDFQKESVICLAQRLILMQLTSLTSMELLHVKHEALEEYAPTILHRMLTALEMQKSPLSWGTYRERVQEEIRTTLGYLKSTMNLKYLRKSQKVKEGEDEEEKGKGEDEKEKEEKEKKKKEEAERKKEENNYNLKDYKALAAQIHEDLKEGVIVIPEKPKRPST